MSVRARSVSILMMCAALSACLPSAPEPWQPPAAPESQTVTTFGRDVPAGDHAKLQVAEQIRGVDPCALAEPDQLARYGTVAAVAPYYYLSECIVYVTTPGRELPSKVKIDLSTYDPLPDDERVQVAGETVVVDRTGTTDYSCGYRVPMRFRATAVPDSDTAEVPDIVELPPVPYLYVSASDFRAREGNCGVAQDVVSRVVAAFAEDRVPRRDQSPARLALTDRSPCELLERFPDRHRPHRFDATAAPYDCQFWIGNEIVSMKFDVEYGDNPLRPVLDYRIETIAGYRVLVSDKVDSFGVRQCIFEFAVGPGFDGNRPGTDMSEGFRKSARVQPMANLTGVCEITRDLIPAALELFGANR